MLGLSRWSKKGGNYRTMIRFFHSTLDWGVINWFFIKIYLTKNRGFVYLLGGNKVVVSKSGKKNYGLDRFYSSIQNQTSATEMPTLKSHLQISKYNHNLCRIEF